MIQIENLRYAYNKKYPLFTNLNCTLEPGNIYGLLGKNGAGKTTLLKIISGLLFPKAGNCMVAGRQANKRNPNSLQEVFFIPEDFNLPDMSILQFEQKYSPFYPKFNKEQFAEYLSVFGLRFEQKIKQLSMGMKKQVIISFGLALNTPFLIMDEPTNGLDIPSKSLFRKMVAEAITPERSFIISTHQARDLEQLIDPILILENGEIVFHHSYETIQEKLAFKTIASEETAGFIYGEKTLNGYRAVLENQNNEFTQPNLELLFNSVVAKPDCFTFLNQ